MKNKKSVIYNFSNKPQLFIINDRVVSIKGDNVAYINKEKFVIIMVAVKV
jgi:hypothetical protein